MEVLMVPLLVSAGFALVDSDGLRDDWDYAQSYGQLVPSDWYLHYPKCGGKRQSPVNIVARAVKPDPTLAAIKFINYDRRLENLVMQNNGHTLSVAIPEKCDLRISSPSLPSEYRLVEFHFHWPSEHAVNGKHLPLELHLVHKNAKSFSDRENATSSELVVLAVVFDYSQHKVADALRTLISRMIHVVLEGDNATLHSGLVLSDLLPSRRILSYVRYSGSLTTPPCTEAVEFIILTDPMPISEFEANHFMLMRHEVATKKNKESDKPIAHNERPIQRLNGRRLRLFGNIGNLIHK